MHPNVHCSTVYNSQEMSINRRMDKDVVQVYNGILLSYKKERRNAICHNMDRPGDYHTEWSKSNREEILYDIPYMWNQKRNDTNELTRQKRDSQAENKLRIARREGIIRDFGKVMYTLLYIKWITNKNLLYSTWNSAQCYVLAWMEGKFAREWIYAYVWLSPFAVHLKLSQHC